jgi:hypothetical protein
MCCILFICKAVAAIIRTPRPSAAFISRLRRRGRIWVAAIDMHGEHRGNPSGVCGIHRCASQVTATAPPATIINTNTSHNSMKEWINEFYAAYKSSINQIPISWDVKNMLNVMEKVSSQLWNFNQDRSAICTRVCQRMVVYTASVSSVCWFV